MRLNNRLLTKMLIGAILAVLLYGVYGAKNNFIDWDMVTALGTTVAAIAAIVSIWILYWQAHFTTGIQTLTQMLSTWQSEPMFPRIRQRAAQVLWECAEMQHPNTNEPALLLAASNQTSINLELGGDTSHIDEVLNFFEMICVFVQQKVLDFELTYQAFSWEMSCYWLLTETYIRETQRDNGDEIWRAYSNLMPLFNERSGRAITVADARGFLLDERSIAAE